MDNDQNKEKRPTVRTTSYMCGRRMKSAAAFTIMQSEGKDQRERILESRRNADCTIFVQPHNQERSCTQNCAVRRSPAKARAQVQGVRTAL